MTFRLVSRTFLKNKLLMIFFCLAFAANASFCVFNFLFTQNTDGTTLLGAAKDLLSLSNVFFVFFLFLAYEVFYLPRRANMSETLAAAGRGERKFYFYQLLFLFLLCLLFALPSLIFLAALYFIMPHRHTELLSHLITVGILQFFLVSLLGVVLGLLAALRLKRLPAYLFLALCSLLSGSAFEYIATRLHIFPLYELFNLSLYFKFVDNPVFGFSALPYRWARIGMWLFFAGALILYGFYQNAAKKRRNLTVLSLLLLAAACLVLYAAPASKVDMSEYHQLKEMVYYAKNPQLSEAADFYVTQYDMDFSVGLQLSAKVQMMLSQPDLPQYRFTLYHGYRVKRVTDENGSPLAWTRDGDYITVQNNAAGQLGGIVIKYAGSCMTFFSNSQAVYLSGAFPYYPREGFHAFYLPDLQTYDYVHPPQAVPHQLRFRGAKELHTNLERQTDGSYYGVTNGVTLISGFLDTVTAGETTVVYPYLATDLVTPEIIRAELEKAANDQIGTPRVLPTIFSIPNMNNVNHMPLFTSHMELLGFLDFMHIYNRACTTREKDYLYTVFYMMYFDRPDSFRDMVQYEATPQFTEYGGVPFATPLLRIIEALGEQETMRIVNAYLFDESDTRTDYEFIMDTIENERVA